MSSFTDSIYQFIEAFKSMDISSQFDITQQTMFLRAMIILVLILGFNSLKHRIKQLEKFFAIPLLTKRSEAFTTVDEYQIRKFNEKRAVKVYPNFPEELIPFILPFNDRDLARWFIILANTLDQRRREDIKRAITIGAAFYHRRIPKAFVLIDEKTKALWIRMKFDMELISVDKDSIQTCYHSTASLAGVDESLDNEKLGVCQSFLPTVGEVLVKYTDRCEFPCFSTYFSFLTGLPHLSEESLEPSDVKAMTTAFACMAGIQIPVTYVCNSRLTMALVGLSTSL